MEEKFEKAIATIKQRLPTLTDHADMQKVGQAILNLKMAKAVYAGFLAPTDELDIEIGFVLGKVRPTMAATDMQQVTQAALHLVQAKSYGEETALDKTGKSTTKKQGAGA